MAVPTRRSVDYPEVLAHQRGSNLPQKSTATPALAHLHYLQCLDAVLLEHPPDHDLDPRSSKPIRTRQLEWKKLTWKVRRTTQERQERTDCLRQCCWTSWPDGAVCLQWRSTDTTTQKCLTHWAEQSQITVCMYLDAPPHAALLAAGDTNVPGMSCKQARGRSILFGNEMNLTWARAVKLKPPSPFQSRANELHREEFMPTKFMRPSHQNLQLRAVNEQHAISSKSAKTKKKESA